MAHTGGGAYPVEVCRQGKCDNARLQKAAVRQASVWMRCIRLWPSRLLGHRAVPSLVTERHYSDALVPKCLQPKLALLVEFGLLWLLAYSGLELRRAPKLLMSDSETAIAVVREACLHPRPGVYPMSGIICSQGGHLISGQMAKAFSSA